MAQENNFIAGQNIKVSKDKSALREELWGISGKVATVVDILDHVVLIQLSDEDEAFMIRCEELVAVRAPESWNVGETVGFLHEGEEMIGDIFAGPLSLAVISYVIRVNEGHDVIVPADNLLY